MKIYFLHPCTSFVEAFRNVNKVASANGIQVHHSIIDPQITLCDFGQADTDAVNDIVNELSDVFDILPFDTLDDAQSMRDSGE